MSLDAERSIGSSATLMNETLTVTAEPTTKCKYVTIKTRRTSNMNAGADSRNRKSVMAHGGAVVCGGSGDL
jgi:hypothetical protein